MARPPDYSPDYRVTTAPGKPASAVVTLFRNVVCEINATHPDYRSHPTPCSHPVVTLNVLISNHKLPLRLLTTSIIIKEIRRGKVEPRRVTRGGGYFVVRARITERDKKCRNTSRISARTKLAPVMDRSPSRLHCSVWLMPRRLPRIRSANSALVMPQRAWAGSSISHSISARRDRISLKLFGRSPTGISHIGRGSAPC